MNAAQLHVDPFTLLHSSEDGSVLSFRHRALETSHSEAMRGVESGKLVPVTDPAIKPTLRTCLECGCTDKFGCEEGCTWVETLLCSRCSDEIPMPRSREEIEGSIEALFRARVPTPEQKLFLIQTEILLDIRDALFIGAQNTAMAYIAAHESRGERRIVTPGHLS